MPKKELRKKQKGLNNKEIQLALIENFVNMQRVLTNLSVKFDVLSDNISKLLQLFEISARSFIRKTESGEGKTEDKDLLNKLDTLLDQNKTIAKGLTLIEEQIRHKVYGEELLKQSSIENRTAQRTETENIERQRPKPLPKI